jgi:hypothetical protein
VDEHDEHDEHDEFDAEELAALRPARPRLPLALALFGTILVAASAMPLTPGGASFLQLVLAALARNPLEGLVLALGFGSPFWFGLVVALGAWPKGPLGPGALQQLLISNASLLHAQLLLAAWMLWRDGLGMMPGALLGFAIVSGGLFTVQHASARAAEGGDDPQQGGLTPRWLIRWTATVIVAICGWLRLQVLAGLAFGWAVEVALASAVALALVLARRPQP